MNQMEEGSGKGRKYRQPLGNVGEKRGWVLVEGLREGAAVLSLDSELSSTGGCLWRIAA